MFSVFEAKAHAVTNMSVAPVALLALEWGEDFDMPAAQIGRTRHNSDAQHATAPGVLKVVLRLAIAICMLSFAAGPCVYATTLYWSHLRPPIASWWGEHDEMVDATFLTLACVTPLVLSTAVIELLRRMKRSSPRRRCRCWTACVSSQLRRRPQFFAGRLVSWFSYGELLFLLVLLGGNFVIVWHTFARKYASVLALHPSTSHPRVKLFGRSMGYNCIFNMVFLFLPATRSSEWMEFLNISYANAIRYHRWLGVLAVVTAATHCGCYYWCWVSVGKWQQNALPCWRCSWSDQVGRHVWVNVFGELALLCFLLIAVTSLPVVRRRMYNTFYSVHHLFLAAVAFSVLHWGSAAWFLLPSFVAYLASRAISQRNVFGAAPVQVLQVAMLSDNICKIVLARDDRDGDFEAGKFVYLNVPEISTLQWHPFTVANGSGDPTVTLVVKALGDWTDKFVQHARECMEHRIAPKMFIDGFYGASLRTAVLPYDKLVLVGGGIGVTPLLALLEEIAARAQADHAGDAATLEVHFVFSFREAGLLVEIAPLLHRLQQSPVRFRTSLFWTRTSAFRYGSGLHSRTAVFDTWSSHPLRKMKSSRTVSKPFAPAAGPCQRAVASVSAVVVATLVLAGLEYNWDAWAVSWWIFGSTNVWVVQRTAQLSALFLGATVVYALGVCRRVRASSRLSGLSLSARLRTHFRDIESAGDRLNELLLPWNGDDVAFARVTSEDHIGAVIEKFGVRVGEQPNLDQLLRLEHQHGTFKRDQLGFADEGKMLSSPIGVFVSGPERLKAAVQRAVAAIGSDIFDVHAEEFEL